MRRLIASINITLDGFMAGPNCELDWHFKYWDDEMARSVTEQLAAMDAIVLGRKTYQGMAAYWNSPAAMISSPREDVCFATMLNEYEKLVFSGTMKTVTWSNSRLLKGSAMKQLAQLKAMEGKDMIIYGSCGLLSSLQRFNVVDEYRLWLHPVIIGKGKPLFSNIKTPTELVLYKTEKFSSGVILLYYRLKR